MKSPACRFEQAGKISDVAKIFIAVENTYVQIGMRFDPGVNNGVAVIGRTVIANEQFVKGTGLAGDGIELF